MKNPRLSGKSESESFETRYKKVQKCQYDKVSQLVCNRDKRNYSIFVVPEL